MIVMPANNTAGLVHYLAGAFPGSVGLMMSPDGWRRPPFYMPYALDNGAFTGFDPVAFMALLQKPRLINHKPLFVAVPDRVSNAEETLRLWHVWHKKIHFRRAFVAQDGHEAVDVPHGADAVFVGGSTDWKIKNAHKFKGVTPWLHIGRVSTPNRLQWARDIGADSVDGTGFFRDGRRQLDLIEFITGTGQLRIEGF